MLVLVSFVLVLAAAVTLVVGLLQSGLTLIYLSIACSVLAGVVLAVAVLRGRPEPRVAAGPRSFAPPAREPQVPASVGAPTTTGAAPPTRWSAPTTTEMPTPTPPPPPPPPSPPATPGDDEATKAAGTALLGRLRGRRAQQDQEEAAAEAEPVATPAPAPEPEPVAVRADDTVEVPVTPAGREADDGFPIADYDRLRATELLSRLPELDRNQLEAVRDREMAGKNRFTILSRIDALLAAQEGPAWEVVEEDWEAEPEAEAEEEPIVLDAEPLEIHEQVDVVVEEEWEVEGEIEDDEVDELVSPAEQFPITDYDALTVGQILPRLSELDADELAQVRSRELQGRSRATILDRIDRLAARSGAGAATAAPPARKAAASRKSTAAPAKKRGRAATPEPAPEAAPLAMPPATPARAPKRAVKKATTAKAAPATKATPATKAAPAKKASTRTRKATSAETTETVPVKDAVKKARATRKTTKKQ